MKTLVKMIFGSKLYGTDSELSDTDYKGIFLPELSDCILGKAPKNISKSSGVSHTKNTNEDIDEEMFSLQRFIEMACRGEMIVIDMLHANKESIIETSPEWEFMQSHRSLFYTKNIKGYIGYIKRQVAKYGFKGTRLGVLESVLDVVKEVHPDKRVSEIWENLPDGEFISKNGSDKSGVRIYEVCGKKIQETAHISYFKGIVQRYYDSFGERALAAKNNAGIDWKAVSHAFRACIQLKEIFKTGDLVFPLEGAKIIKDIKYGKFHFVDDCVGDMLEDLLNECVSLSEASSLPETMDVAFWHNFILKQYGVKNG